MSRAFLAIFLPLFGISECLTPSPGCEQPLPNLPKPGHSRNNDIVYDDKLLGIVTRSYIIQVPSGFSTTNSEPTPLVLDFHGYTGNSQGQSDASTWKTVGDEEGFLVIWPNGMADNPQPDMGSWNCSQTDGPLGRICADRSIYGALSCYNSCPLCDPITSCDWSSCYDDIGFTKFLIDFIASEYCVDLDHIHLTGYSNGGMFSWYAASLAPELGLASINPVAASSLIGFGVPPVHDGKVSIIDFHGINDDVIPYDIEHSFGLGPHDSLISNDGYYYDNKRTLLNQWAENYGCEEDEVDYPTPVDGVDGFACTERNCQNGLGIVHCSGSHTHTWPIPSNRVEGTRVAWSFMKNHPKVKP